MNQRLTQLWKIGTISGSPNPSQLGEAKGLIFLVR
jgi:hypothetical protein